jgi:hypothetical protein
MMAATLPSVRKHFKGVAVGILTYMVRETANDNVEPESCCRQEKSPSDGFFVQKKWRREPICSSINEKVFQLIHFNFVDWS